MGSPLGKVAMSDAVRHRRYMTRLRKRAAAPTKLPPQGLVHAVEEMEMARRPNLGAGPCVSGSMPMSKVRAVAPSATNHLN